MSKLRAVIVEDERKSMTVLKYLVERHAGDRVELVETFTKSSAARDYIKLNRVDLVFLDIQMPGMDGFELLDSLEDIDFDVIFTTAFDNYATRAFRYYAVDYLLKPVIVEELVDAIDRLEAGSRFRYGKRDLSRIFSAIHAGDEEISRLAVPTREGVEFILLDSILRLEADGNYTHIYLQNGTRIFTSKTLKFFEALLPEGRFYRPHQSHIINVSCMRRFVKSDGGYIVMSDNAQISLARSKRQDFSDRFY